MQTLTWLAFALALGASLLCVGLATAALLHRPDFSPGEDALVAFGAAVAVPALATLALIPLPLAYVSVGPVVTAALLLASLVILWHRRAWLRRLVDDPTVRLLAAGVAAAALLSLLIGALPWDFAGQVEHAGLVDSRHVPHMPGDSYLQYRTAQFIQNRLPPFTTPFYVDWFISDRTPMVGLLTTFVASAVHWRLPAYVLSTQPEPYRLIDPFGYWIYRQVSILTNALVIAPAVLLAQDLLGRRQARLGLVLVLFSPFVLINLLFHWPKLLVGFFIVSFFYWCAIRRRPLLGGAFAAGGVLSHPVGALWIPGMLAYLLWKRSWSSVALATLAVVVLLLPWFLWTSVINHHPSRMLTYPIGYGITDPTQAAAETARAWQVFIHRPLSSLLRDRWVTIRDTLIDWPLLSMLLIHHDLHGLRWPIFDLFRTAFPGMFGLPLALWGYLSWRRIVAESFWLCALGVSTVAIFLFWGITPRGITIEAFQPGAALWICVAAALLRPRRTWIMRTVVLLSATEAVVFAYGFLLKVPPLSAWSGSEFLLVGLSLVLVGGIAWFGWRHSVEHPTVRGAPEAG